MKKILIKITFLSIIILSVNWVEPDEVILSGMQPQLSLDNNGIIRVVFGRADSIFCATSSDKGKTFSKPLFIGHVAGMHLGMTRGPQIASSANYSVVTAMDHAGNIHFFQLNHSLKKWKYEGLVNDIASSAPEGLMGIAADNNNNFYAVWLDVRKDKQNNVCFSSLFAKTGKWKQNRLIYVSPDKHVCECCKPSIAVRGSNVVVMFRNWVGGSRDLYAIKSGDGGKTFGKADKLGSGTWKLNGCPMDGGDITIDNKAAVHSVWQRDGVIYYCKPGTSEINVIKGRGCKITENVADDRTFLITYQEHGDVKMIDLINRKETNIGKGSFVKSIVLSDGSVLCVWEQDKNIRFKRISV